MQWLETLGLMTCPGLSSGSAWSGQQMNSSSSSSSSEAEMPQDSEQAAPQEREQTTWAEEAHWTLTKAFDRDFAAWREEPLNDQKKDKACLSAACLVWFCGERESSILRVTLEVLS